MEPLRASENRDAAAHIYVRVLTLSFVEKHFIGTIFVLRKGYLQEHVFVGVQLALQRAVC